MRPRRVWDYPVLMNFWSSVIGLAVSVHFWRIFENLLIQLTSNLAEKISWGFAGLMPILKTVTFGIILFSLGNIRSS